MTKTKKIFLGLFFAAAAAVIAFSAISLYRYQSWQVFYYDFGYFARIIWKLSRFKNPVVNHISFGRILFLGDHFSPSLALLAPLFWITSSGTILLIEQAVAIVITGLLIFLIGRKLKLDWLSSLIVTGSYLVFTGTLSPLISDWHPESTALVFLLGFIYLTSFKKNKKNLWLMALIGLVFVGFKESNGVILTLVCLWLAVIRPKKRKFLIIVSALGLSWFLIATRMIIPALAGKYHYMPQLPANLEQLMTSINHPQKIDVVKKSLISFGLVPLLAPGWLGLSLAELATRYLPVKSIFENFSLGMHYQVYFSGLLGLATAFGLKNWQQLKLIKKSKFKKVLKLVPVAVLLVTSLYSARRLTQSPINMAINPTLYQQLMIKTRATSGRQNFISHIPQQESIMGQNNILPRFYNQQAEIYLLQSGYQPLKPKHILFDLSADQNSNNFYGPNGGVDLNFMKGVKQQILADPCYQLQTQQDQFYWFKRVECEIIPVQDN